MATFIAARTAFASGGRKNKVFRTFAKGGNYTRDQLPEADLVEQLGGQVQILPYLDNRSTTGLIERIHTDTLVSDQVGAVGGGAAL